MRVLVLGGTVFAGRAVVEEALRRGHSVTIFHRGEHGADAFGDAVERILGDRNQEAHLKRLKGRLFDVAVDMCGFNGRAVGASARLLADSCERYVFVSSGSVYTGWPERPVDESSEVFADPVEGDGHYGEGKAAAERAAEAAMPGRVVHSRSGLIVGPHENIGRLPFWLRRMARGGEVLAPGQPGRPVQWIDARDHAGFLLDAPPGTFNVVSPPRPFTMGSVLAACAEATGAGARLVWVSDDALLEAGIEPWTQVPMWTPDRPEWAFAYAVDSSRALASGLRIRPVEETVNDTWDWMRSISDPAREGAYRVEFRAKDLDPALEAGLLRGASS